MTLRMTGWALVLALLGGAVWKMAAQTPPQVKVTKGFTVPYSDPKDPKKRILFTGDEAIPPGWRSRVDSGPTVPHDQVYGRRSVEAGIDH